jgi:hypothetical protein
MNNVGFYVFLKVIFSAREEGQASEPAEEARFLSRDARRLGGQRWK